MVETLSKRRTHYEVLGLTPAATDADIERAFVREFGCFQTHTVGRLAEGTVAYKTLRDPARRRAYDASLRPVPEPAPPQSPVTWRIGGQVMTATATPAARPAIERVNTPLVEEPAAEPEPNPQPVRPFIAATLDELASQEPLAKRLEARARPRVGPAREPQTKPTDVKDERRVHLALSDLQTDEGGLRWKRAGIVLGGVAAVVALLGAWAGWESAGSAEPTETATKAVIPPPTTYTVSDPAAAAPDRVLDVARSTPLKRSAHAASRVARIRPASRIADLERGLAEPRAAPPETATAAIAPAEAPPTVAGSLPLSSQVIARTIERIGYPCGQIASTAQGEAPGVFEVTCTSGHSYQAAPVRGRYHFRRLGRR